MIASAIRSAPLPSTNLCMFSCADFLFVKETSVASFIAVKDMMKGANALVGFTYNMNIPYLTVALIYLILVLGLQKLVGLLERRLRSSDH